MVGVMHAVSSSIALVMLPSFIPFFLQLPNSLSLVAWHLPAALRTAPWHLEPSLSTEARTTAPSRSLPKRSASRSRSFCVMVAPMLAESMSSPGRAGGTPEQSPVLILLMALATLPLGSEVTQAAAEGFFSLP